MIKTGSAGRDMSKNKWNFRKQATFLFAIVLLDAALLGVTGGVAGTFWPIHKADLHAVPQSVLYASSQKTLQSDMQTQQVDSDSFLEPRQIALTFDDGPHKICTPQLLDGLKERGVHATFFLMGENIAGNEELVRRMKEEGHLIGNHSYRHIQLTHAGEDAVCEAIEKTEDLIESITGDRPEYLRPPYGDWNESLECRMDLTTVLWSVDSLDWKLKNTNQIVKRVKKNVSDGDIILMHDIFPTSLKAALQIIDELQAQGYTFVTVEELLID